MLHTQSLILFFLKVHFVKQAGKVTLSSAVATLHP